MSTVDEQVIPAFGAWLSSLSDDAKRVVAVLSDDGVSTEVRRPLAGALNYLFKSLDLIDDGIEGLGFLDDAFVLRIAAADAAVAGTLPEELSTLAADAVLVREFLAEQAPRLDRFVAGLVEGTVRGRSVASIVDDPVVRDEFLGEVGSWASRYEPPKFSMDDQALVKMRSFLGAKLPA